MMLIRPLLVATLLLGATAPPICANDQDPKGKALPSKVRVWEGYLWRARNGATQIGWPVIAMGVRSQPDHVIAEPLATKLKPLMSSMSGSYVFWNYRLEEPIEKALRKLPRVLVRVRGAVTVVEDNRRIFGGGGTRTLRNGRLQSVEFVSDSWLTHWGTVYREVESPFRIRERPPGDPVQQIRNVAPRILAALRGMKKCAGATEAQRKQVVSIDKDAKLVQWFRQRTEWDIQRWLIDVNSKHKLNLKQLDTLGKLPPTSIVLRRWFLDAKSRTEFLKKVRAEWGGDVGALRVSHYVKRGNSTFWTTTTAAEIEGWTDELFDTRKKTSIEMEIK